MDQKSWTADPRTPREEITMALIRLEPWGCDEIQIRSSRETSNVVEIY